ncbi:uncharacterized protein LOC120469772 [Tachysurus ichikawai]
METYAILDDGAQRTMILPTAVQQLQLHGEHETLALRTVRLDTTYLSGSRVTFEISPRGSDQVHLITAKAPVRQGTKGGPVAIRTVLGWALQGAEMGITDHAPVQQCFFTSTTHPDDLLYRNVERLWQLDVLPFRNEKLVVRSRQDKEAMQLLESRTQRVTVDGVQRYATPLLWKAGAPKPRSMHFMLANLRSIERRLRKDPEKASIYSEEITKLIEAGCVFKLDQREATQPAWYLPHHLHHAYNSEAKYPGLQQIVHQSFYVDNCMTSFPTASMAKQAVNQLRSMLAERGFDLKQWASSHPAVVAHLPSEAWSSATEQWLLQPHNDLLEPALGLRWNCAGDTLGYHYQPINHKALTMRAAYQVLASQYDPLGFILPFTTRAKVIIQQLWAKKRDWDDPDLPPNLQTAWTKWEGELVHLGKVSIPRCYSPASLASVVQPSSLHVFCDASERAYGAVAYLVVNLDSGIHVSFIMARSRVAPKRQQSIPRLELCAALAGAQLAKVVREELTISIGQTILWTDSMTVLERIQSDSCRYKVFVGTRVSEIQELTDHRSWRYVNTQDNPADDITRGKTLQELSEPSRWSRGPSFLKQDPVHWPKRPEVTPSKVVSELKGSSCYSIMTVDANSSLLDATQFRTWQELLRATQQTCQGPATSSDVPMTSREAEVFLLRSCQAQSFPEEVAALEAQKPVRRHSRLVKLAPEWDSLTKLIRVGGRLRRLANSEPEQIHPKTITKLLIKDFDERLLH